LGVFVEAIFGLGVFGDFGVVCADKEVIPKLYQLYEGDE